MVAAMRRKYKPKNVMVAGDFNVQLYDGIQDDDKIGNSTLRNCIQSEQHHEQQKVDVVANEVLAMGLAFSSSWVPTEPGKGIPPPSQTDSWTWKQGDSRKQIDYVCSNMDHSTLQCWPMYQLQCSSDHIPIYAASAPKFCNESWVNCHKRTNVSKWEDSDRANAYYNSLLSEELETTPEPTMQQLHDAIENAAKRTLQAAGKRRRRKQVTHAVAVAQHNLWTATCPVEQERAAAQLWKKQCHQRRVEKQRGERKTVTKIPQQLTARDGKVYEKGEFPTMLDNELAHRMRHTKIATTKTVMASTSGAQGVSMGGGAEADEPAQKRQRRCEDEEAGPMDPVEKRRRKHYDLDCSAGQSMQQFVRDSRQLQMHDKCDFQGEVSEHPECTDVEASRRLLRDRIQSGVLEEVRIPAHAMVCAASILRASAVPAETDGIPPMAVKRLDVTNMCRVRRVFQRRLNGELHSTAPLSWRQLVFTPIPKAGEPRHLLSSYRWICSSPIVAKLHDTALQQLVRAQMCDMPDAFVGFRKTRQSMEIGFGLMHVLAVSRQWQLQTCVCSLDVERAFDVLRWSEIESGMEARGASEHFMFITRAELRNVQLQLRMGRTRSDFIAMSVGTKQGSVNGGEHMCSAMWHFYFELVFELSLLETLWTPWMWDESISIQVYADNLFCLCRTCMECQLTMQIVTQLLSKRGMLLKASSVQILQSDEAASFHLKTWGTKEPDVVLQTPVGEITAEYVKKLRVLGQMLDSRADSRTMLKGILGRTTQHFFARKHLYCCKWKSQRERMQEYLSKTRACLLSFIACVVPLKSSIEAIQSKDHNLQRIVLRQRWRRGSETFQQYLARAREVQRKIQMELGYEDITKHYWRRYHQWAGHVVRQKCSFAHKAFMWANHWTVCGHGGQMWNGNGISTRHQGRPATEWALPLEVYYNDKSWMEYAQDRALWKSCEAHFCRAQQTDMELTIETDREDIAEKHSARSQAHQCRQEATPLQRCLAVGTPARQLIQAQRWGGKYTMEIKLAVGQTALEALAGKGQKQALAKQVHETFDALQEDMALRRWQSETTIAARIISSIIQSLRRECCADDRKHGELASNVSEMCIRSLHDMGKTTLLLAVHADADKKRQTRWADIAIWMVVHDRVATPNKRLARLKLPWMATRQQLDWSCSASDAELGAVLASLASLQAGWLDMWSLAGSVAEAQRKQIYEN